VGAGNIGAPLAAALAQAGFSVVDVLDHDVLSEVNRSRGLIYHEEDIEQPKAEALAARLHDVNPYIQAHGIVTDVRWGFGIGRFATYDYIFLATHDLQSRQHVNRFAHLFQRFGGPRAIIEGAIDDLSFSLQTILPGQTPCYTCALPPDQTDPTAYQGCNGVVTEVALAPAATNGMDGLAVAALMAKEGALLAADLEPFYAGQEFRLDGAAGTARVYRRVWRPSCDDHCVASPEEVITVEYTTQTTRVATLRKAIAARRGVPLHDVHLYSLLLITARLVCACGQSIPVMRPQQAPLTPSCPACHNADPDRFHPELLFELTEGDDRARTLGDYGIPDGQALEAYIGAEHYYVLPVRSDRKAAPEEADDVATVA
jgi:adenylyltransferase/sulfurtransferase